MELRFLGAAGTVTGSRYLVETAAGARVLIDCGLFQGLKQLRLRNRAPFPVPPSSIDAVLLTHAHIDHTGYLPALLRDGMAGRVLATAPTADLAAIMLPDSAHLQEEEARFANRHRLSRHHPAEPLYTRVDAERAVERIEPVAFEVDLPIVEGITARYRRNGHILGSGSILLDVDGVRLVFSGDIGRPEDVLMHAPRTVERADYLVMESTYGGRHHEPVDTMDQLGAVVRETAARGGVVIVPAFAVGRAQALLVQLGRLRASGDIPPIPVFLDSPMARDVTELVERHAVELKVSAAEWRQLTDFVTIVNSVEESKAVDRRRGPMVIVSASGMATGGRVVHHLKVFASDHRNTILFAGFQAPGTRGQAMVDGAHSVRIHGMDVPVNAEVRMLDGLSAHADETELLQWLRSFEKAPVHTWLTHGEPLAADTLRRSIQNILGWECSVPEHLERVQVPSPTRSG
ncbi:MAG: MBL fold metallo-hydrolase [Gemmatimonadetes bacterium]|nr:MBL fold metallo-hydrolase [Gemmatimonadota bacterium]